MDLSSSVIWFVCLVTAVILHEVSHGIVALWFGDHTAKEAGRLTLNPVPHIDPFGSIILPAMGALAGIPVIAWAKPVPVDPRRMRDPRRDMLWVGLAGPASNFVLMTIAALAARWWLRSMTILPGTTLADLPILVHVLISFAFVNLFLGVFNFLPIPPLDGSSLIERVLPSSWLPHWWRFRPYGMLVLFGLLFFTNFFSRVLAPFESRLIDFIAS